jgi:hypothetical protein
MRGTPVFSSERKLHKDYERKGSVALLPQIKTGLSLKRLGEMFGGKLPVVK